MLCIMISIFFFTNDAIAMENEIKEDDSGNYDDQKDVEPNIFTLKKPLLGNIVDFANDKYNALMLGFDGNDFGYFKAQDDFNYLQLMCDLKINNYIHNGKDFFMNSKDPSTYADFINNFFIYSTQYQKNSSDILSRFKTIQYFKFNNVYVDFKFEDNLYKEKINKYIYDKFNKLISEDKKVNYVSQLRKLQKDLYDEFLYFDSTLINYFNEIFNYIKIQIAINKNYHIKREL